MTLKLEIQKQAAHLFRLTARQFKGKRIASTTVKTHTNIVPAKTTLDICWQPPQLNS